MYNQIFIFSLLFYVLALNLQGVLSQAEGGACTAQGSPGVCRSFSSCPAAIQALQQQRGPGPVICSFPAGSPIPVVCCVEATASVTTTTTTRRPVVQPVDPALAARKSYQKCKEYAEYVYEWIVPPTGSGTKVKVNRCAQVVQALVVGGEDALPREFPHMASLGFLDGSETKWQCGGALISENFVLTAGHCLFSPDLGEVKKVRVGDLDLARTDEIADPQEFDIAEVIRHPQHKPPSRYNDIALLRLAGSVKLNSFAVPACLRWDSTIQETRAIATGWGRTKFAGSGSSKLQKVTLDLFTQDECNATYAAVISNRKLKYGIVPDTQLCAGSHNEEKDTCQGDSGGPLQVFQKNGIYCMYSLVGVTSFGSACGVIGSPGVYTRVSAYLPWIESIVWS